MEEVIWGIGLIAVSLLIHGFGMIATLRGCVITRQQRLLPDRSCLQSTPKISNSIATCQTGGNLAKMAS
jgi:hypothetical protein